MGDHILETAHLRLRPWKEAHAEALRRYAARLRIGPVTGWPVPAGGDHSLERFCRMFSGPEIYAVVLKEADFTVGCAGLLTGKDSRFDLPAAEGELGYWMGVPYWGRNLIPEAVKEMVRHGFEDLRLCKIWCGYFEGSEHARQAQEACGFQFHHTAGKTSSSMADHRAGNITCLTREEWKK